jgi:hypothetical protein
MTDMLSYNVRPDRCGRGETEMVRNAAHCSVNVKGPGVIANYLINP